MMRNSKEEKLRKVEKAQDEAPIPSISKLIMSPPPPAIGGDKTISFSVTDQVPLKDVLIELGRVAKIDVDLDPAISGGVIINAKNRPLKEVIDRISSLGGLRYSYINGVLHFERDAPYMKNYFVDYLTDGTVWADVESNLTAILSSSETSSSSGESSSGAASFSSNKSAGIISLYATDKQHQAAESYLADVEKYASAQVLIEAKVVEVLLSDEFKSGIDWSWKSLNTSADLPEINFPNTFKLPQVNGADVAAPINFNLTKRLFGGTIEAAISAIEKFGTTKTLSSPRIHAMNNQKADLNFGDKLIYFKVESTVTPSTTPGGQPTVATTSTKQEENVGIQLSITPSISLKTNEITMNISPKLSAKTSEVTDPVNPLNKVPVIQSRDINTIAKIQSGNIIVIGGLMKESGANADTGVPILSRIPILGWLFRYSSKESTITETVIFIKATIVNSGTPANKVDRNFQEKFDSNKRRYFE